MQTFTITVLIAGFFIHFALFFLYYLESDREKFLKDMKKLNKETKGFSALNILIFLSIIAELFFY
jgi:hypothetical protein